MLKDEFEPIIAKSLTPSSLKEMEKKMSAYVDRNSDILLSLDLSRRYSFGDDPFYSASILTASHLLSSDKKKGDNPVVITVITYMSLMMWTSLHKGFFKYEANKQVMDYTIAHLDSTFRIRQFPSLFAFIQDNTMTVVNTYKDRIMTATDKDLTWVIDAIWTRLKGKIKKISSEFYKNHQSGRYLNTDEDSYSEEDFHEMDNQSFGIDRLTNKVYVKLINRQYDKRFIKYSITQSDTSLTKITNLIEDIIDSDGESGKLRSVISSMIEFYLRQSGKPIEYIAKGDYVAFMKTAYASNTIVPQMEFIKSTIDGWLADNMYKYGKAKYGKTLQIQYRRCIYMFLVFVINFEAKNVDENKISILTDDENQCMQYLIAALNLFNKICQDDPQDPTDSYNFGHYVDAAKTSIIVRGARRLDPEHLMPKIQQNSMNTMSLADMQTAAIAQDSEKRHTSVEEMGDRFV